MKRPLVGTETAPDLLLELFEVGTRELLEAMPAVWDGSFTEQLEPQLVSGVTHAAKLQASEAQLKLGECDAATAHNRARVCPSTSPSCLELCIELAAVLRRALRSGLAFGARFKLATSRWFGQSLPLAGLQLLTSF